MGGKSSSRQTSRPAYLDMPGQITDPAENLGEWLSWILGGASPEPSVSSWRWQGGQGQMGDEGDRTNLQRIMSIFNPQKPSLRGEGVPGEWVPDEYTTPQPWFTPGEPYGGDFIAGLSPQEEALSTIPVEELTAILGGEPSSRFTGLIESAQRPIMQRWEEQILPSIRTAAETAGAGRGWGENQYAGLVGRAGRDVTSALGDVSSSLYGRAMELAPAYQGLAGIPRGIEQGRLTAEYGEYQRRREEMWRVTQTIMALLSSALGGPSLSSGSSSAWNIDNPLDLGD